MVGWTRRSRESSERRARWWASLTDDEREMEEFLSAVNEPRDLFLVVKTFALLWVIVTAMIVFSR